MQNKHINLVQGNSESNLIADAIREAAALPNVDGRPSVVEDLADFIVEEDEAVVGETPVLLNVKLGKPGDHEWFRVHPDPARSIRVYAVKDKHSFGRIYVVSKQLLPLVGHKARQSHLRQAVTQRGQSYLWPVPILSADSMDIEKDLYEAAAKAVVQWTRLEWDANRRSYYAAKSDHDFGNPVWPTETWDEVFSLALKGNVISDESHPWVLNLMGRVA